MVLFFKDNVVRVEKVVDLVRVAVYVNLIKTHIKF